MRNISSWAIRNPTFPIVLFLILTFLGVVSFNGMAINDQPDITFPLVSVTVSQPGAAPTEMEKQITQKIEGAVASVAGAEHITSYAVEGISGTNIEFAIGTPVDRAVNDVRDAVAKIRSDLPDGILEPQVQRQVFNGPYGTWSVTTTDMTLEQLSWFVDNVVTKRLLSIPGVGGVNRSGGVDREIRVDLDPVKLQAYGVTAAQINSTLRSLNIDATGGRTEVAGAEQAVRVLGGAQTALSLANTQITISANRTVRLGDVATVRDGNAEQRTLTRNNGRETTLFTVQKALQASEVQTMDKVEAEIAKIAKENPKAHITLVDDEVKHTREGYRAAMRSLFEGAFLAVVVVFFFLRDWRATLISAIAIPLSCIPAFFFMNALGFTLNGISLLALSLVAGILVDDAIVEIENIVRHMRMGKTPWQASMDAADEIGLAVVATTMAIVAVFLPVALMPGISGQYFKQFGLTVVIAVLMSLLVARLITPLCAAYFLRPHGEQPHGRGPIMLRYISFLRWSIRHRWLTVLGGVFAFGLTIYLGMQLPVAFQPPRDSGQSTVTIEMAPGVRLEDVKRVSGEATRLLRARPEVQDVLESVGQSDEVRFSSLQVTLVPRDKRKLSTVGFERDMAPALRALPDARVNFQSQTGGFGGYDITVMLVGDDPITLHKAAESVVSGMKRLPSLRDSHIDADLQRPEIVIKPHFDLAAQMGVSVQALSQTIRIATIGDVPQNLAKFSLSDRQIPIRVQLPDNARNDLETIRNLPVPTSVAQLTGPSVPLKVLADIDFGEGAVKIRRYNQGRRIALVASLAPGAQSGDAMNAIYALPAFKNLPQGVKQVAVGDQEWIGELFINFITALVAGVLLVFAVLILLYRRILPPFVNMASLFLAPLGAVIALLITGMAFSLPVCIGLLMLLGVVAKNSILLIDFAIEEMRMGIDRVEAILDAGRKRAQPIVMTSVAMVAGMLPVALSIGTDGSFRQPMGVAVIGGITLSTILTLIIVPAAFTIADDLEKWMGRRMGGVFNTADEPAAPHVRPGPVAPQPAE
ncbi:efflux RND transporter permease subunit [Glacieibacterium megasporae]|uniref:efflux RND transporter permease subunit n=1 Tax=Glacieibacterium megasporae TaxID=2835787 RepID=UPI001C1DDC2E|nr:efflux RND transporter permease subunit [Polymorphobacter megasporae]UAJ08767.1 efflux RND transporter permease subunit [Polymorphobacter megasporae]